MTMALWVIGLCLVVMATPIINAELITPDGCGITKGCFHYPEKCASPSSCSYFLSWTVEADGSNIFEMTGNVGTYVAVGFSRSGAMRDSDVYACTKNLEVVRSRNLLEGNDNEPRPLKGVSDVDVSVIDGRIECRFKRQMLLTDDKDLTYYDLSEGNSYTIIMAKSGINLEDDGNIKFHYSGRVQGPRMSFTRVDQTEVLPPAARSFKSPMGCGGPSDPCEFEVTWKKNPDGSLRFDMSGNAESYVALGFSKSGAMADSDVYACTSNNVVVRSRNTMRNDNDKNQPLKGVSDESVSTVNGGIECSFTRQVSLDDGDNTFFNLGPGNSYTIIMSKSNTFLWGDGNIMYHFGGKVQGPVISFSDVAPPPMMPDGGAGGCGSTRGCFFEPRESCTGPDNCDFFVSWVTNAANDHVFTISGKAKTYVALGFSKSGKMMDSDVYACTNNNEVVRSRNTVRNQNNKDQPLKGVSDWSVSAVNGRIECTFTRQASLNDGDPTYYDLSGTNRYTIIMARSNGLLWPDGNIMIHTSRVIGAEVSFNEFNLAEAKPQDNTKLFLQKAHGCLMIIAWVGFASIGITIARYMKHVHPGTKICDKKPVWFAVHRFVMVMAFLCTVAAFVIIFISVGGFVDPIQGRPIDTRYIHAILGTIVTFLAIINPIMAIFRPHPGTPRRPIFNWAHWGVGTSAHVLGMVTICFALINIGKTKPLIQGIPSFLFWVMIVYIVAHITTWIMLELKTRFFKNTGASDDIPLKGGDNGEPQAAFKEDNKFKDMTFRLYIFVAVVLAVVMVIIVARAKNNNM
ncbi:putative ferric-chelate reductase 1 [Amphiura filiformis]|uniref:putative ferric-chelate reductase 1 n=1 Tax=Amphiura filiformis TaxID=82378 RepID=UPI003B21EEB8